MVKYVIKRTGEKELFQREKIESAVYEAVINNSDEDTPETAKDKSVLITNVTLSKVNEIKEDSIHIEKIQDLIEDALMLLDMKDIVRAYIRYRYQHEINRLKK